MGFCRQEAEQALFWATHRSWTIGTLLLLLACLTSPELQASQPQESSHQVRYTLSKLFSFNSRGRPSHFQCDNLCARIVSQQHGQACRLPPLLSMSLSPGHNCLPVVYEEEEVSFSNYTHKLWYTHTLIIRHTNTQLDPKGRLLGFLNFSKLTVRNFFQIWSLAW
jgi:hypothetical protein